MPRCSFRCWSPVEEPLQNSCPAKTTLFFNQYVTATKGNLHSIEQRRTSQIVVLVLLSPYTAMVAQTPPKGVWWTPICQNDSGEPSWAGWPCHWRSANSVLSSFSLSCYSRKLPGMFLSFSSWALVSSRPSYLQQQPCLCINPPSWFIPASTFPHGNFIYSLSAVPLYSPIPPLWI